MDGFIIRESNRWYQLNLIKVEVVPITRISPTKIMLKYSKCQITYDLVKDDDEINSCYNYRGLLFTRT